MYEAMTKELPQIHLINLDRSADRLHRFWEHNRHLDESAIRRVSAMDGASLDRHALISLGYIKKDLPYGAGTLGCAMSHIKLWEMAVAENRSITIFEDNVVVSYSFDDKCRQVLSSLPADWDIIQWGYRLNPSYAWIDFGISKATLGCYGEKNFKGNQEFQAAKLTPSVFRLLHSFGLQAYSISPKGARVALEHCLPLRERSITFPDAGVAINDNGIDMALCGVYPKINAFICMPQLVMRIDGLVSLREQTDDFVSARKQTDDDALSQFLKAYSISEKIAKAAWYWQKPITISTPANGSFNNRVQSVRIHEVYNRFGNNFFQVMNALVICSALECHQLQVPQFQFLKPLPVQIGDVVLTNILPDLRDQSILNGTFNIPLGFERFFETFDATKLAALASLLAERFFENVIIQTTEKKRTLALHFRGGDNFNPPGYPPHKWYVQPPASYYIKAAEHVTAQYPIDHIELVYEDRTNPALEIVEEYLSRRNYPFTSAGGDVATDIRRLSSANYIVASYGTFTETIALLSRCVNAYYGFRSHSTQHDVAPFTQSKIGETLRIRGVKTILIKDANASYIAPKSWENTPAQRAMIRNFPESNLSISEVIL